MDLDEALRPALNERRRLQLYRSRATLQSPQGPYVHHQGKTYLAFCSNDYLGLANHPQVCAALTEAVNRYGVGSGASHLVNGHSAEHHALEEELAVFTGRARALLFSSGYMANLGVINALVARGDAVFEDKLNHASLLDGALLSRGQLHRFAHNDPEHLRTLLQRARARHKLIVVDGVFSMDGDLAPLTDLSHVAEEYGAWLMVDDAHGFGCLGASGQGSCEHWQLSPQQVPVLMGTLGKALGSVGAFVAGSEVLIESLIQFARPYIYTTALPPALAAASRASLQLLQQEPQRREHLASLVAAFRAGCQDLGLPLWASETAIQPLIVGDAARALQLSHALAQRGFWVSAIRPPTVPRDTARLRVTLSAAHSHAQVASLLDALAEVYRDV